MDRLAESLQRSQAARELEIQLRRLRKAGGVLQGEKTIRKETGKQVPQMELKLPEFTRFSQLNKNLNAMDWIEAVPETIRKLDPGK